MKRLIALDGLPPGFRPDPGDALLALTPRACLALDGEKRPYSILHEFGFEEKRAAFEKKYWPEQLAWFRKIDETLGAGLSFSTLFAYFLKISLDNLVVRALEARCVRDAGFEDVTLYVDPGAGREEGLFGLCRGTVSNTARVWPGVLKALGARCRTEPLPARPPSGAPRASPGWDSLAKDALFAARAARWALLSWKARRSETRPLGLLFMETYYAMGDVVEEACRAGHRCFLRRGDKIVDVSGPVPSTRGWGPAKGATERPASDAFAAGSPLWNWPDQAAGTAVEPWLGRCYREAAARDLTEVARLAGRFDGFYRDERIDFVLLPSMRDTLDMAAVAAARRSTGTKSVLLAHGDGPDFAEMWDLTELLPYHHYFVPDEEFAAYFRERRALYPDRDPAQVHVGSPRWRRYRELARPRAQLFRRGETGARLGGARPPLDVPVGKPVLVYALALPDGDYRHLNKPCYSETWYFALQKALAKRLAGIPGYSVVFKLFPNREAEQAPLVEFVRSLDKDHFFLSRARFSDWLPFADRVLMDQPSTPLYEAALAGVPFHLLCHRDLAMRPAGLAPFRKQTTVFDSNEEACAAVAKFLRDPAPSRAALPVPPAGDVLSQLAGLLVNR
jgi:hypothetical protein